jgi:hypothetical protein
MVSDPATPTSTLAFDSMPPLFTTMSAMSDFRSSDPYLRQRYGISDRRTPQWVIYAIFFAIVGGGWLLWSGSHYSRPDIRASVISFEAKSDSQFQIRYSLNLKDPTRAHYCRLVAHDYEANVVGEITDQIPAGTPSGDRTTLIPTRIKAVSAAIDICK